MKSSPNENEVAILDSLNECKVVRDGIGSRSFDTPSDMLARFEVQTRRVAWDEIDVSKLDHPTQPYDVWKVSPEFKVEDGDVAAIRSAAVRIINQRKVGERLFNRITGRKEGARSILNGLAELDLI